MARVLLVDDHPDLSAILSQLLESYGHSVHSCDSAEAAWRAIDIEKPDAIIVDHRLPGMSGVEFIRRLREVAAFTDISVLCCSADEANRAAALAAGASEFWLKGSAALFDDVDRLGSALAAASRQA